MLVTQLYPILCNPMDCSPPAPLSMRFPKQEYWSGLPFPSLRDLPNPGLEPGSLALQEDSLLSEPPGKFSNKNNSKYLSAVIMYQALCGVLVLSIILRV